MGLLVVDNGVQLALEGGLVYAMFRANVLRKQNPFGGMLLLFPRLEVTQGVLVSLRERGTVNHVCIAYLTGGYRLIVHPLSLKKREVFRVSRAAMLQLYLPVEIHRLGCTVWHCPTMPAYMEDCFPVTCGKIQKA